MAGDLFKRKKSEANSFLIFGPHKKPDAINNKLNEEGEKERGERWRGELGGCHYKSS